MSSLDDDQIQEAFNLFSPDSSGNIDMFALKLVLKGLGFGELTEADAENMMRSIGLHTDGQINFPNFQRLVKEKMNKPDSDKEMRYAFNLFDTNSRGRITQENLSVMAKALGKNVEPEELEKMIAVADKGKTGACTFDDFKQIMDEMRHPITLS